MSILTVANGPLDLMGGEVFTTTPHWFMDPDFAPEAVRVPTLAYSAPAPIGFSFPVGATTTTWVQFVLGITQNGAGTSATGLETGMTVVSDSGNILGGLQFQKIVNSWHFGRVFAQGTAVSSGTQTFVLPALIPVTLTLKVISAPALVTVELYINGNLWDTATAATGSSRGNPQRVMFTNTNIQTPSASNYVYYREIIVTDNLDPRDLRAVFLLPSTQGFHDAWVGGATQLGDNSKYARAVAAAAGLKTSMGLSAYSGPSFSNGIAELKLRTYGARGASGGPTQVNPFVRIAGTDYQAGDVALSVVDTQTDIGFTQNPATSAPWTSAEIAALEIGLLSVA